MGANLYLEYSKLLDAMGYRKEALSVLDNGLMVHRADEKLLKLQGSLHVHSEG